MIGWKRSNYGFRWPRWHNKMKSKKLTTKKWKWKNGGGLMVEPPWSVDRAALLDSDDHDATTKWKIKTKKWKWKWGGFMKESPWSDDRAALLDSVQPSALTQPGVWLSVLLTNIHHVIHVIVKQFDPPLTKYLKVCWGCEKVWSIFKLCFTTCKIVFLCNRCF